MSLRDTEPTIVMPLGAGGGVFFKHMSYLTFILGGARSGKSRHAQEMAEKQAVDGGSVLFIATATASDAEMEERIARHRLDRPARWQTIEEPLNAAGVLREKRGAGVVVIDCLTLFVTNHLLAQGDAAHCAAETWDESAPESAVEELIAAVKESPAHVIIVSNEVGLGLVPSTPLGRVFRDVAGRANQRIAEAADSVLFMVAGLPMKVK